MLQPRTALYGRPPSVLDPSQARKAVLLVVTLATLLQLAIYFNIDNLIASTLLLCGAYLGLSYAIDRQRLNDYPLSTLAILGYTIYQFVIPPVGKLLYFQSILRDLHHPILVWIYGDMGLLTLLAAHYAYRQFSPYWTIRWALVRRFYRPLHFFDMPDTFQLWLMGGIGIAASLFTIRFSSAAGSSALYSVARIIRPLIYTPFFTAFPNLIDPRYKVGQRPIRLGLIIYSILLLAVAAMMNSRSFMLTGFASLVIAFGYRVVTGTVPSPKLSKKSLIIVLASVWLVGGPVANLAASMVIARRARGTVSPQELAKTTWNVYRSGIAIKAYEQAGIRAARLGRYNETYFGNVFLDRIGNVRFTDISIDAANGVKALGDTPYFRKIEFERVAAILPGPLLRALNLQVDKTMVLSGSSEDFLYQMATGNPAEGYKTGSPLVILQMTFGLIWPICCCLMATVIFCVLDASTDVGNIRDTTKSDSRSSCVVFSPVVAGTLLGCLLCFTADDVAAYIGFATREWIETGVLYGLVFVFTRTISSLMFRWAWQSESAR